MLCKYNKTSICRVFRTKTTIPTCCGEILALTETIFTNEKSIVVADILRFSVLRYQLLEQFLQNILVLYMLKPPTKKTILYSKSPFYQKFQLRSFAETPSHL